MDKYNVSGMSCAACVSRVEKAVSKVDGVESCSVNLLTNSMTVEGTASSAQIEGAVKNAGYSASRVLSKSEIKSGNSDSTELNSKSAGTDSLENDPSQKVTKELKGRLLSSIAFLLLTMYFSMGPMFSIPMPEFFLSNKLALGLVQLILSAVVLFINRKFFISGFSSIAHGAPNMDTLVALGSGISWAYSTVVLFMMTDVAVHNPSALSDFRMNFYFEGAAMIVTLITVGKLLESISKGRTTDALKSLMKLAPKTAVVERNGSEVEVPVEELNAGDIFILRPGANIPCDGIVFEGVSSINESSLTGESVPVEKTVGSEVNAATTNLNGFLKCRATRTGDDTTLSKIIQMVSDSASTKAPVARVADKVAGIFVPAVLVVSAVTFAAWKIFGSDTGFALSRAIAVLVVSCPCALGLATPVAIMVANGVGAKNFILFKTAASLENTCRIKTVALDKTGTITKGEPKVVEVASYSDEKKLLQIAASLESKSEHPIAKAVADYYDGEILDAENYSTIPGNGIEGVLEGTKYYGGNLKFILGATHRDADDSDSISKLKSKMEEFSSKGYTPIVFSSDSEILGVLAVADVIKEDSAAAIKELKNLGLKVVMITGDNENTARFIGNLAGVDEVVAGVYPNEKAAAIKELQKKSKVAMVGDGINDAPSIAAADVGFAIGSGTDVAIDSAEVVLMRSSLMDVADAVRLSRKTLKNIHENLFWAFFYNVALIPLAAGAYYRTFGLALNPMLCAAAMSLSSFCVVTNALRLNLFRPLRFDGTKNDVDNSINNIEKKEQIMEKTVKVEGMMCPHCEAHVKEALEKIDGIACAVASHEKKQVVITMDKDVSDDLISEAISNAGYKVIG